MVEYWCISSSYSNPTIGKHNCSIPCQLIQGKSNESISVKAICIQWIFLVQIRRRCRCRACLVNYLLKTCAKGWNKGTKTGRMNGNQYKNSSSLYSTHYSPREYRRFPHHSVNITETVMTRIVLFVILWLQGFCYLWSLNYLQFI